MESLEQLGGSGTEAAACAQDMEPLGGETSGFLSVRTMEWVGMSFKVPSTRSMLFKPALDVVLVQPSHALESVGSAPLPHGSSCFASQQLATGAAPVGLRSHIWLWGCRRRLHARDHSWALSPEERSLSQEQMWEGIAQPLP